MTAAERQAKHRAASRHNDVGDDLDKALLNVNWRRRRRGERDFLYFLKTYCTGEEGGFLEIAPPPEMQPIVRDMEQAIGDSSIPYHIRIARGHGKTAYTKGAIKWTAATGARRYIIAVAANGGNAENIIEDVFCGFTQHPAFVQDFPEIALPFSKLEGAYQRAMTQACHGKPTKLRKAVNKIVLPDILDPRTGKPFPSAGVILEAVGFNAGARGKAKMSIRPDFVILDDLQNDDKAESGMQVEKMARKIKKTFLGLAGHRKKIATIMTSTPIEPDDLSEMFANDPGWLTKTYKMMPSFPSCHDPESPITPSATVRDYWEEYRDLFKAEMLAGRKPEIAANKFYRQYRREMDDGASVINPHNFDPVTEISGIQHAMNLLFRDGLDAFMSEYQMQPPRQAFAFEVTARLILARIRKGCPARTIPQETVITVAATDVNPGYAITTAIVSFDVNLTGLVTAYHVRRCKIRDELNDVEFERQLYEELTAAGREIAAQGVKLDKWGIDAGGRNFKAVTRFCPHAESLTGIQATAMLGRGGANWNPNVRSRIRKAKNDTVICQDSQRRRWLAWDADTYKEKMHRAWATEIGASGGLSLFDGNVNHAKFAIQVANETLVDKTKIKTYDGRDRWAYKWKTKEPHDFGDALAMCYALAASEDVTGEGTASKPAKKKVRLGGSKAHGGFSFGGFGF